MCWTINHSQVNVTDRQCLAFSAANRMNFDNINGIPLFFNLHSFILLFFFFPLCCPAGCAGVPLVIKLSPKFARPIYRGGGREGGQKTKQRGKSLITLACSTVRSLIKPSYLPVTPSQEPPSAISIALSTIKYLGFFFSSENNSRFLSGLDIKKKHTGSVPEIFMA